MSIQDQHDTLLRHTFGFTAHDLDFNRNGQLSPGQNSTPAPNPFASWLAWGGMLFTGGMTLLLLWALVGAGRGGGISEGAVGLCMGLLLFGIPFVMIAYSIFSRWSNTTQDEQANLVAVATGLAQLIPADSGATLKIGGESFWLSGDKASVFKSLEPYRVYYLPHSRRIVSAERVESLEKDKRKNQEV
jgi:hypothetical protein